MIFKFIQARYRLVAVPLGIVTGTCGLGGTSRKGRFSWLATRVCCLYRRCRRSHRTSQDRLLMERFDVEKLITHVEDKGGGRRKASWYEAHTGHRRSSDKSFHR